MDLRQRGTVKEPSLENNNNIPSNDNKSDSSSSSQKGNAEYSTLSNTFWFLSFGFLGLGFFLAVGFQTSCESAFTCSVDRESVSKVQFDERNVRQYLRDGTSNGYRFVGSDENEIHMPAYLLRIIRGIISQYPDSSIGVEVEEQMADFGVMPLDIFGQGRMTSVYRNIRNIVIRIHDKRNIKAVSGNDSAAILVNCHYDSVIGSPGASDDFVSCATMLEVMRVLLATQPKMHHDLVFLLNGAEENMLQGSHAFVTQHRWMKDVKLFVNLEAAGAGGRQLVFQAGPGQPWIVRHYAEAARQPFASVIGQDVFQAGLIPSDTDFRIFRDFGNIPGIDIAYIGNGYVYHTKYDSEEQIPPQCIQHAGDNMLAYLVILANSPYVTNPESYTGGDFVYFDFLGLFLIQYPFFLAVIVNLLSVSIVGIRFIVHLRQDKNYYKFILGALLNHFVCFFGGMILLVCHALVMHFFEHKMTWYAIRYNIFGVYILPYIWFIFLYHSLIMGRSKFWLNPKMADDAHFEACHMFMASLVLVTTFVGLKSNYILSLWIIFPLVGKYTMDKLQPYLQWLNTQVLVLLRQLVMLSIPYTYTMYMVYTMFEVFIPILGRSGTKVIPDAVVAVLVALSSIVPLIYLSGKVYATNRTSLTSLRFLLLHCTLSYLIVVHFTRYGFPYNNNNEMPRKQRVVSIHVNRMFRDGLGATQSYDSGLWVVPLDHNQVQHIMPYFGELEVLKPLPCAAEPYCGFPHIYPIVTFFTDPGVYYLPRKAHQPTHAPTALRILDKVGLNRTHFNLTFEVSGPSHTHIYIMISNPRVKLVRWSLETEPNEVPRTIKTLRPASESHYFIYQSYGRQGTEPFILWTLYSAEESLHSSEAVIKIALSSHYTHGQSARSPEGVNFINRLPDFTVPIIWSAVYDRWAIPLRENTRFIQ